MLTCISMKTVKDYLAFLSEKGRFPFWWINEIAKNDVLVILTYNICNDPNSKIDREWIVKELKKTNAYRVIRDTLHKGYEHSYFYGEVREKKEEEDLIHQTENMVETIIEWARKCAKFITESEQTEITQLEIFKLKILLKEIDIND